MQRQPLPHSDMMAAAWRGLGVMLEIDKARYSVQDTDLLSFEKTNSMDCKRLCSEDVVEKVVSNCLGVQHSINDRVYAACLFKHPHDEGMAFRTKHVTKSRCINGGSLCFTLFSSPNLKIS